MPKGKSTLPAALPEGVVREIWRTVAPNLTDKERDQVMSGEIPTSYTMRFDFTEAAMEHPHFANASDIAPHVQRTPQTVAQLVAIIKTIARESRRAAK